MTKDDKPKQTIAALQKEINGEYGDGSVQILGSSAKMNVATMTSGSISLDLALGGGWPIGRIIEIIGMESSGKTTLALHAVAEFQKAGKNAAFIDFEFALDPEYAAKLGVDLDKLLISQPDSGEQGLEIIEKMIRSGNVGLIVIDSVAAMTPKSELDGVMGAAQMGGQARMMGQAMRKLTAITSKGDCTLMFINQIRNKIGVQWGSNETTPGGNALKFFASVRVDVRKREAIDEGTGVNKETVGNQVVATIKKNKIAPPMKKAHFEIRYAMGIDRYSDLLNTSLELGIATKAGAMIEFEGQKFRGFDAARSALETDRKLFDSLFEIIKNSMVK